MVIFVGRFKKWKTLNIEFINVKVLRDHHRSRAKGVVGLIQQAHEKMGAAREKFAYTEVW